MSGSAKTVAIIGAGLAGAACANAFANAGYSVTVYEQAATPAAGASGVPLAMFAPSVSADDAPYSRLLRQGVNVLLDELHRLTAEGLLLEGSDWAMSGVLERCLRGDKKLPSTWLEPQDPPALQSRLAATSRPMRLVGDAPVALVTEIFHAAAGWVNPQKLIAAWLSHPGIAVQTNASMTSLQDLRLALHSVIAVACGYQTPQLVPHLKTQLQAIRGQVAWGVAHPHANGLGSPINGMGHWIEGSGRWLAGATFQRDETDLAPRLKDADLNFEKLSLLRPELDALQLRQLREASQPWVGVRTAQKNRQPLIEQLAVCDSDLLASTLDSGSGSASASDAVSSVWVCTALGSRGLSLAALCAQQLVTQVTSSQPQDDAL